MHTGRIGKQQKGIVTQKEVPTAKEKEVKTNKVSTHTGALQKASQNHSPLPKNQVENRRGVNVSQEEEKRLSLFDTLALVFQPKKRVDLNFDTKFGRFKLDGQILPEKLQGVSKDVLTELKAQIAKKIEDGGFLYQAIMNGDKEANNPSIKDISDLMWFLQAKAENLEEKGGKKVGSFTSGALSLEDPELHLTHYLDRCKDIYQRPSTHIQEFQKVRDGVNRGIDFNPEGSSDLEDHPDYGQYSLKSQKYKNYLDSILPYNKRSVMIAPMLKESGLMAENRILIKMEEFGYGGRGFVSSHGGGPESRERNQYDFEHNIGHVWTTILAGLRKYLPSIFGSQTGIGTRRERVPKDIKNSYKNLIAGFKKEELSNGGLIKFSENLVNKKANLDQDIDVDPLSNSGGIRVMYDRAKSLIGYASEQTLNDQLELFCEKLKTRYPEETLKYRIGDEVILTKEDLAPTVSKKTI